jgi:hypothetical protein
MNKVNPSRYVLSVCVTATLFAGCGGSQSPIAASKAVGLPMNWRPALVIQPSSLGGETFTSTEASSKCHVRGSSVDPFKASGDASGPFSGTFYLNGRIAHATRAMIFRESFKITTKTETITGSVPQKWIYKLGPYSCTSGSLTFDLKHFRYQSQQGNGHASASLSGGSTQSFIQSFQ